MTFYCPADQAGPRPCPDWIALYRACTSDAETDAVDQRRAAEPGHVAANGAGPSTSTLSSAQTKAMLALRGVEHGSDPDELGGRLAYLGGDEVVGRQLLCPVCRAPLRVVG